MVVRDPAMGEECCQAAQVLAEEEEEDTGCENEDKSDAQEDCEKPTNDSFKSGRAQDDVWEKRCGRGMKGGVESKVLLRWR